jgi:hypothetical protein
MDSARHAFKRILNPRFQIQMASYDVASTMNMAAATADGYTGTL